MSSDANLTLTDGLPVQPEPSGSRRPSLVELSGGDLGRQVLLEQDSTVIGRGTDVDVRLRDARSSRRHAVVTAVVDAATGEEQFHIRDLNSSNGTFVNGQKISDAPLRDGDKIQIGHTVFKFALKDTVELDFESKIYQLATTDPLTGLYTRDFLFKEYQRLVRHSDRYQRPFAVVMVDLDDFKGINDTHGHIAGDRVLEAVGKLLKESLRAEDIVGRYGGEEFLALLPETNAAGARFPAQRFLGVLRRWQIPVPNGPSLSVTASIGIAGFPEHGETGERLLAAADDALYTAKHAGKNCVVIAGAAAPEREPAGDAAVVEDDPFED